MGKPRSRRDMNLRLHIAYLAARLMAEDGGLDYGAAKSKAARQANSSKICFQMRASSLPVLTERSAIGT